MDLSGRIKASIRDVIDYPKEGIIFKDITPVLARPDLVKEIILAMAEPLRARNIDAIAAVEARGFIFGSILAHELGCRFVPIRKAGKLPFTTRQMSYNLEYGTSSIEMHTDAIQPGWKVVVHDDLLATGGTAMAAGDMVREFQAELAGFSFLINLGFLPGEKLIRERFGIEPHFVVNY